MKKEPLFIAFSTQKGGAGKTTLTVLMASYLYYVKGYDVAVVDCDYPQFSIKDMRERDLKSIERNPYLRKLAYEQFKRIGKRAYPIVGSRPGNAIETVRPFVESATPPDFIFPTPELPGPELPDSSLPDNSLPDSPDSSLPDNSLPGEPDNPGTAPEAPGDTVPGDPDNGGSQDAFADAVVELVNAERAKAGLSPLSVHDGVAEAANKRAQEIKGTFSHTRPDGSNFSTVLTQAGISYRSVGENIAYGQNSPEAVMQSWMNSSGHRANILNRDFTSIGVGHYQDASGTDYWTQLFIK